jgi:hypothetical protein
MTAFSPVMKCLETQYRSSTSQIKTAGDSAMMVIWRLGLSSKVTLPSVKLNNNLSFLGLVRQTLCQLISLLSADQITIAFNFKRMVLD